MNLRYGVLCLSFVVFGIAIATGSASAQTRVGEAAVVRNEVVHVTGSGGSQINVGDAVLRDEIDRTVFNDEHTYRDIAIRLTTGAFRFVTGHSEKTAYKITTSVATIGVRGTVLDILAQRGSTTVVLQEGASS